MSTFTNRFPSSERSWTDLSKFDNSDYDPGRGRWLRITWYLVSLLIFESGWVPLSRPKSWLLRLFGARIGRGLIIKPHVRIKYPWRLTTGDHCWIGQEVWIDNLADVRLGNNVCLSQKTYICTGSHDFRMKSFDLITSDVVIHNGAWVAATSVVLGGVEIGANALLAAGSLVKTSVPPAMIVGGVPARILGPRPKSEFLQADGHIGLCEERKAA
ncbi:MAG: WcaF family extracellular polysaccharide biosynthesis acetyltransferase [Planctomycetales bacterium]